jgi:hypothetical protein
VGLFALNAEARAWMVAAAGAAARQLGIDAALDRPRTAAELARALGVAPRRLGALVDVLACAGVLARADADEAPTFTRGAAWPAQPLLPPQGWGRLAEILTNDRPLPSPSPSDDEQERERFHAYLRAAGATSARALMAELSRLPSARRGLVDLGGGAGAYTEAFLAALPGAPATLVDREPVIALARAHLLGRASLVAGDLFDEATAIREEHGIALLANVLHLYGARDCQRLVARAAASVAPGEGWVVVQDLYVAPDRTGPLPSLLFALNMAVYTEEGDVHDGVRIAEWLARAGLVDVEHARRGDDEIVVRGRRA